MPETGTVEQDRGPSDAPGGDDVVLGRFFWVGISGLMLGMFLAMLDSLIIATSLPTIVGDLGGLDHLSWVITAYLLATAASTAIWGKLGDLYGRKKVFMLSITLFLAGSILSGVAQDMAQLIGFRALQGLGGGGLMVGAMAIIGELVPPRQSGKIQGMMAVMMPTAFVGGPLIGGFLTDHFDWRWVFYVNVPIGIVALIVTGLFIHTATPTARAKIDYVGTGLLTVGIVALTLLTSWAGTEYAWGSFQIVGLALVSLVALVAFGYVQRRVDEPLMPPRMFRDRNFVVAQLLAFLSGAAMFTATNFLPQYTQFARDASSTKGGLLLLPMMLGMVDMMVIAAIIVAKRGRYRIFPILGGGLITVGMLLLLILESGTNTLVGSLLTAVIGLGVGCLVQNTVVITMNSVEVRDMGAANGANTLARLIGASLGVALLGVLFTRSVKDTIADRLGASGGGTPVDDNLTPERLRSLPAPVRDAFADGMTNGLHAVAIGGAVIGVLTFAVAWFIREVPLRDTNAKAADGGEPENSGAEADGARETEAGVAAVVVTAATEPDADAVLGAPRDSDVDPDFASGAKPTPQPARD
ncbi:MDR family MFS transporter [Embleya hyalina]|uniref:MFS transporter n=1 Tax=Embleya hyalina TaxID=516124 RepID=A0A401Z2Q3_9ACTN|nr:MDR family MFS transporter [Embleya hyalina]GCE01101.1 MFS transporter [Embleya hyalina]